MPGCGFRRAWIDHVPGRGPCGRPGLSRGEVLPGRNRGRVADVDGDQLAQFLRMRRAAVQPADAVGGLRRVAGLRREEVAERAGISLDYYTRLEQNRTSRPSAQVVASLATALEMTEPQRAHLHRLADHPVQPVPSQVLEPEPALLRVLEQLTAVPAHIMTDLGETLAQNRLSVALFSDASRYTGASRSTYYSWFTDPAAREVFTEETRDQETRARVADLRATLVRRSDAAARDLVAQLLRESREFEELWAAHEVSARFTQRKRVVGPTGVLELYAQFLSAGAAHQILVVFTPADGTDAAERLRGVGELSGSAAGTD
ncbi:helix-turn-helix domain-containing protein [Streptomyces aureus]|uniref:helix-turn-helix domain-containing protein n=1 Tax=Streptomyces aureus TaxID=193461 RepID=UPI0033CFC779